MNVSACRISSAQRMRRFAGERLDRVARFVRMPMHWWAWRTRVFVGVSIGLVSYALVALGTSDTALRRNQTQRHSRGADTEQPADASRGARSGARVSSTRDVTHSDRIDRHTADALQNMDVEARGDAIFTELSASVMRAGLEIDRLDLHRGATRSHDARPVALLEAQGTYAAIRDWISRAYEVQSPMVIERLHIARVSGDSEAVRARLDRDTGGAHGPLAVDADAYRAPVRLSVKADIALGSTGTAALLGIGSDARDRDNPLRDSTQTKAIDDPFDAHRISARRLVGRIHGLTHDVTLVVGPKGGDSANDASSGNENVENANVENAGADEPSANSMRAVPRVADEARSS